MRTVLPFCLVLGAATLLLPAFSQAAEQKKKPLPVAFCVPASEIAKEVEDCEDNDAFIKKGEDCLERLEKEVAGVASSMKSGFAKDAEQKQTTKFSSSLQDYALSSESLAYLIGVTGLAIQEMEDYKQALVLPEDADEPEVNQGDSEKYIQSMECYGDSKDSLADIGLDFKAMLKQLETAKKVADGNVATSSGRGSGLGADDASVQKAVQGSGKDARPDMRKGKQTQRESEVTGVRESIEKQKQK